jgi:hypothetical protein
MVTAIVILLLAPGLLLLVATVAYLAFGRGDADDNDDARDVTEQEPPKPLP